MEWLKEGVGAKPLSQGSCGTQRGDQDVILPPVGEARLHTVELPQLLSTGRQGKGPSQPLSRDPDSPRVFGHGRWGLIPALVDSFRTTPTSHNTGEEEAAAKPASFTLLASDSEVGGGEVAHGSRGRLQGRKTRLGTWAWRWRVAQQGRSKGGGVSATPWT